MQGRWSLTDRLFAGAPEHSTRMRAISELMLERYGIVTRETVLAEGIPGGFSSLYGELANLETLGTARRGYFVEGLGGAQFALPAAIERLRGLRSDEPAGRAGAGRHRPGQPLRRPAALAQARRRARPPAPRARRPPGDPGRRAVAVRGEGRQGPAGAARPRRGRRPAWLAEALEALAEHVRRGRVKRLAIERFDGQPVVGSAYEQLLIDVGFRLGPRKLTLSA